MAFLRISKEKESEIKDSANIFDVMEWYGFTLKRCGVRHVTLCPFHPDRTPSLYVGGTAQYANKCHCYACGKHLDPVGFIMEYEKVGYYDALKILAEIGRVSIIEACDGKDSRQPTETPSAKPKPPAQPAPKPTEYTERSVMEATMRCYDKNPLCIALSRMFGEEAAVRACLRYNVGTAKAKVTTSQGERMSTVFWQVDENGNIRGGKLMPYDERTAKRIHGKGKENDVTWVHAVRKQYGYGLCQCLFGQHLITPETKRVNIVESEKTAMEASLYFGESKGVWVATGGKTAGEAPIIAAYGLMQGKEVILHPDSDGQAEWSARKERMERSGLNVTVSRFNKILNVPPGAKKDIGDYIQDLLLKPDQPTATPKAQPTARPASPSPKRIAPTAPPCTACTPEMIMPENAPTEPRAPGETEQQARERNAAIINAAWEAWRLMGAYKYGMPTIHDITIIDPAVEPPRDPPF